MSNLTSPQAWKLATGQKKEIVVMKANLGSAITTDSDIYSKLPYIHNIISTL